MTPPPYLSYPFLAGDRISLREILEEDINDIIEISFYDGRPALNEQDAFEMNSRIHLDYQNGSAIHWGISDNNSGKLMGTCGFYRGFGDRTGEMGCVLKAGFRGQGIMSMALKMAIEFGWNSIGLDQIIAITHEENSRARNLCERLGFIQSGNSGGEMMKYELRK